MSTQVYSETVNTAREYYNSEDADNFYSTIWGGEDIHVGLYQNSTESIFEASRRAIEYLTSRIPLIGHPRILDVGAGYGGAARFLAREFQCPVVALNLSETENARHRAMNREQGLSDWIKVVDGSFENIPYPDESFDVVWSQDAILHSGNRARVIAEVFRVLRTGGSFVFTDPMQADNCPEGVLQPILDRIHLKTLGSPSFYLEQGKQVGFVNVMYEDHTYQLTTHYRRVLEETKKNEAALQNVVLADYIERMKAGLQHWIDGGQKGYLAWGIFVFKKP